MKKLSHSDVQNRLLNILVSFYKYCQSSNLRMYLCAGTLLGAIRHKGFIPWDDDIDVCMPRRDYNILLQIAKTNYRLSSHYAVTEYTLGNSDYPFIKIVDLDTYMKQQFEDEQADYLWIDVFPMDGLPASKEQQKKIYSQIKFYRQLLMWSFAKIGTGTTTIKKIVKPVLTVLAKIYGKDRLAIKLENIAKTYDYQKTGWIGDVIWGDFNKETMTTKSFFESTTVTFEKQQFTTFKNWDEYLSNLYGNDYMKIPEKKDRHDHHLNAWLRSSNGD